jgi:hypothetical protein
MAIDRGDLRGVGIWLGLKLTRKRRLSSSGATGAGDETFRLNEAKLGELGIRGANSRY